jgi:hypothetical protein
MTSEILTPFMAKQAALKFLKGLFYRDEIAVTNTSLDTSLEPPAYHVTGTIVSKPRNPVGLLLHGKTTAVFSAHVNALSGTVTDYDVT